MGWGESKESVHHACDRRIAKLEALLHRWRRGLVPVGDYTLRADTAAVLDKEEPERCPTCNSNDREKRGVEMLRNMTQDFVDCRNPWHGGTDDQ